MAPGIFLRGQTYWLRHTVHGQQERVSLQTSDYSKAVQQADQIRGKSTKADPNAAATPWSLAVEHYIFAKEERGKFRKGRKTSETVEYACKAFQAWGGYVSPYVVPPDALQNFYDAKKNDFAESTLRGYVAKVATFLRSLNIRTNIVDLDKKEVCSRKRVLTWDAFRKLIRECEQPDLKFILHAGFDAGMRKDEILAIRPSWIDLDRTIITIPAKDPIDGWESKSRRSRQIPILPHFHEFLKVYLKPNSLYVLRPEVAKGRSRYRWDFRRPFADFVAKHDLKGFTPHCMRHSYITHLCLKGIALPLISEWSGDRIKTIESTYWHGGASEEAVALASSNLSFEERIKKLIQTIVTKGSAKTEYQWTKSVPAIHARIYSVQDTIGNRGIMASLLDPGDDGPHFEIPEEDWEFGCLSTERARLRMLQDQGYIGELTVHT